MKKGGLKKFLDIINGKGKEIMKNFLFREEVDFKIFLDIIIVAIVL